MPPSGEDRLLRWLRAQLDEPLIGDDAAVLPDRGPFAVTMDSQIEGIHFKSGLDPAHLARRLLAVNLSDLAAMGAVPAYAFLALATQSGFDHRRFFRAFLAACNRNGVNLAGGDLAKNPGGNSATLTLLGTKPQDGRWLRREGARPGHDLWLGGTVGESAAGRILLDRGARLTGSRLEIPPAFESPSRLRIAARRAARRHLFPEPQLALGQWLGKQQAGAAIDVSDGVARDLHRLCRESGVGADVEASALLTPDLLILCERLALDPLQTALAGGEDYVLLFTLPAGTQVPRPFGARWLGTMTEDGVFLIGPGKRRRLPALGWDHLE